MMVGEEDRARSALIELRNRLDVEDELDEVRRGAESASSGKVGVMSLLLATPVELRRPLMIACVLQLAQQFSGINVVFYVSGCLLSRPSFLRN